MGASESRSPSFIVKGGGIRVKGSYYKTGQTTNGRPRFMKSNLFEQHTRLFFNGKKWVIAKDKELYYCWPDTCQPNLPPKDGWWANTYNTYSGTPIPYLRNYNTSSSGAEEDDNSRRAKREREESESAELRAENQRLKGRVQLLRQRSITRFGSQEQIVSFLKNNPPPISEIDRDISRTGLRGSRTQFALRYQIINSTVQGRLMKTSHVFSKAMDFIDSIERQCRKFKIGITNNPARRASNGFPHQGYQVQYDRMDIIFRGTRDLSGALESFLVFLYGINGPRHSDKCINDAPGDEGGRTDEIYYTYVVSL